MLTSSEKRDFRRLTMGCQATLSASGAASAIPATLVDLSAGGMRLATTEPLEAGAKFTVQVAPGKDITPPLTAIIEVIRCEAQTDGSYAVACSTQSILPEDHEPADRQVASG